MARPQEVVGAIRSIRRLIEQIVKKYPDTSQAVEEIAHHLDLLEAATPNTPPRSPRRSGEGTRYAIQNVHQRLMLAEHRPTGRPLRASRELFDAVVETLAQAKKPVGYDELAEGTAAKFGSHPIDWQLRVVLRFLLRATPAILRRERSRYFPEDRRLFKRSAETWWNAAEQQ